MPPKTSYGKEREETISRDFCVEPPILQVCQLIRHEATTVWYDMTRFNLDIGLLTANEELDDPIDSPEVIDAIADRFFIDGPAEMVARGMYQGLSKPLNRSQRLDSTADIFHFHSP